MNESSVIKHPRTPECDKLLELKEQSQILGDFLDWISYCEDLAIAEVTHDRDINPMVPTGRSNESLIAEFLGLDLEKIETERRELLAHQRLLNAKSEIRKDLGLED